MTGQVRIIGGTLRGRKLPVLHLPGLRPTPDRVRETVFNWLQPLIGGAHCLDMFAGSGALGFEAVSRGAAQVTLVEQSAELISHLRTAKAAMALTNIEIYQANAPHQLKIPAHLFDIVFLDPPYDQNLIVACCQFLEKKPFLADEAYIYLESAQPVTGSMLPTNWRLLKSKQAGHVYYHLAHRVKPSLEK